MTILISQKYHNSVLLSHFHVMTGIITTFPSIRAGVAYEVWVFKHFLTHL